MECPPSSPVPGNSFTSVVFGVPLFHTVSLQPILDERKISDGDVDHVRVFRVAIFGDDETSPPSSSLLEEIVALEAMAIFIHREWVAIPGHGGIEYDERLGEVLRHTIEFVDDLKVALW